MVRFHVEESAIIEASALKVYNTLADYNVGHPSIMPPKFFDSMKVLRGTGVGEGTRFEAIFKVFFGSSTKTKLIMDVTEPEKGRIIQEIDTNAINITRFIVDPIDDKHCKLTITTDTLKSIGLLSSFDTWIKQIIMKIMYKAELDQVNKVLKSY